MLKKVTITSTEQFKKGLTTYANLFKLKEGQSPDCINVQFNIDDSVSKRLGTSTMNTTALQGTGGWGMFDGGVTVTGLDTATKLLIHANGVDQSTDITDSSAKGVSLTAVDGAEVDTDQKKFGTGSMFMFLHDTSTKLLVHCEGADAQTTFTDVTGKTVTANGQTQKDTAQKKFGVTSMLLDGNGDFLSSGDSSDWDFGTGDFTLDTWVRWNDAASPNGDQCLFDISRYDTGIMFYHSSANDRLETFIKNRQVNFTGSNLENGVWYHIALVRSGTNLMCFVDGTSIDAVKVDSANITGLTAGIRIGHMIHIAADRGVNGWMDEPRISNIARWTENFTAPVTPYYPRLTADDDSDWSFSGNFTVDYWARFNSISDCIFFTHGDVLAATSDKSWAIQLSAPHLEFLYSLGGSGAYSIISSSWAPVVDTWYHVALARNDTTMRAFIDGTQIGSDSLLDGALYNSTDNLVIGAGKNDQQYVNAISGWMEEIRISDVVRWSADFSVPTEEYQAEDIQARRLICSSGTGIYYSSDLGRTWVVTQTSRTQAMNHFSFIKSFFINTNDDYQAPHYWAGSGDTYFAPVATDSAPLCKYSLSYQGFAILLNEKTLKRQFYYVDESELFTKDSWSNFEFPTEKNDELTGGFVLRDKLYVSSKFKLYRVSYIGGNPDWTYKEVKNWGFVPETYKKVQIPGVGEVVIGLDWERNLRLFNGFEDEIVSTDIEQDNGETPFYMNNLNNNNLKFAWGEDDKLERLYRLFLVYGASDSISKELVYNYRTNAFYPNENRTFQFGVSAQDTAGGLHMMACDYSGRIHHIDSGNTDGGTAIDEHYASHLIIPQSPAQAHKAQKAYTYWNVDSTGMMYFEDRTDYSNVWNLRKSFELVSTISAVGTSQAIDLPTIAKTYQYKVHSSASTAEPWQLNKFDYANTVLGIGKP